MRLRVLNFRLLIIALGLVAYSISLIIVFLVFLQIEVETVYSKVENFGRLGINRPIDANINSLKILLSSENRTNPIDFCIVTEFGEFGKSCNFRSQMSNEIHLSISSPNDISIFFKVNIGAMFLSFLTKQWISMLIIFLVLTTLIYIVIESRESLIRKIDLVLSYLNQAMIGKEVVQTISSDHERILGAEPSRLLKGVKELVLELVEAEKTLAAQRTEVEISKISMKLAHDIRSPISALNAIAPSIKKNPDLAIGLVERVVDRIGGIAEELLQSAKDLRSERQGRAKNSIENLASNFDRFDLVKAVQDIIEEKRLDRSKNKSAVFHLWTFEDKIFLPGTQSEFQRVISNLIENSIEAIQEGGTISVRILKKEVSLIVSVFDNGIGISKSDLAILQANPRSMHKANGNGLGLKGAMEYMSLIGGDLAIFSDKGKGTTVELRYPTNDLI